MTEQRESPLRLKWREIVRRQQDSGLSIVRFCRENQLVYSTFYAWKRRVAGPARAFVEAKLVESRSSEGKVQIRLRNGRRLIVGRGFDHELLAEVVAAVEGLA
jgi:Transposase